MSVPDRPEAADSGVAGSPARAQDGAAPSAEQQQLEAAIAGLLAQRALLGDAVVDAALGPMRSRLAELARPRRDEPAPRGEAAQALRLVTVLFTDMVGSTLIAERVDAEDMLELSSQALARLSAVVDAHGGRVLRYTGDGLKAAFGADAVREDDAERAVACGLAMQAEAAALAAQWRDRWPGVALAIRVGVHSGEAAVGGGIEGGSTAMGRTVNLAARLEQSAAVGGVHISDDTRRLLRGRFELEAQPPFAAKGFEMPIISHRVVRARSRGEGAGGRGLEGPATRMIGRDSELDALRDAWARLIGQRRLSVLGIVADPGIGKSRLLHEFEAWRRDQPAPLQLLRARATPQTEGLPFGLLRDLLTMHAGIADDDAIDVARRKFERAIMPLFVDDDGAPQAEAHAHLLGHLLGIDWRDSVHLRGILDEPRQIRSRALHAAEQVLRRLPTSSGLPLLVELEDLHWADNDSLDFLDQLFDSADDLPMLVIALSRPTLFERRPHWPRAAAAQRRITLAPLDEAASRQLLDQLLGRLAEIPVGLRSRIIGDAGGNPYYLEELVRMLIDQGAIRTGAASQQPWHLDHERLRAAPLPPTLTGVLQARLDSLPAGERLALQEASIVGAVFSDGELQAIDDAACAVLPALVRRELALARPEQADEYAFKHPLLHQVTYGTVLKRSRRDLHGKLARWLAGQTGLRAGDRLGVIASHFELADEPAQAAEFHARAAEHAAACLAHETVMEHVRRGLLLSDAVAPPAAAGLRWRLLELRERSLELRGDRRLQAADIDALEALADQLGDLRRQAHAAWRRSVLAQRLADWPVCEQAARRAMALAAAAGAEELRLLAMRLLGRALIRPGDLDTGAALVRDALAQARGLGLASVQSFCLNTMAVIAGMRGDVVGVLEHSRQDLEINRSIANRRGEAVALSAVGCALMDLGEHRQAADALEQSLRLLRANGDRPAEAATLCSLSTVALRRGEAAAAIALAQAAADIATAAQSQATQAIAYGKLGNALVDSSRFDEAALAYRQSLDIGSAIGDPARLDAQAGLARVALAAGRPGEAAALVGALLDELAAGGTLDGAEDPRRIELSVFQVLAATGDARAAGWLRRAKQELQAAADAIGDDALRRGFVDDIPTHREIAATPLPAA